jgi:hypothetical protein
MPQILLWHGEGNYGRFHSSSNHSHWTIQAGYLWKDIQGTGHAAAYLVLPLAGIGQECKLLQC